MGRAPADGGAFLSTAYLVDVNFVSMEWYRGDTRGFEFGITDWMIIALIITMARSPRWRRERLDALPPNSAALVAYLAVALLSLVLAYVPVYAGFGLFKLLRAVAVYWVAYNYLRDEEDLRFLLLVLVAMVGIQFALLLWQRATGLYRAVGSTPHPNTLAVYANFMNMIFLAFVLGEKRRSLHTWAAWAGLAMGTLVVLATFSRGALMVLALGFAIVIALSLCGSGWVTLLAQVGRPWVARYPRPRWLSIGRPLTPTASVAAVALDTARRGSGFPVFLPPRLGRRLTGCTRQPRRPAAGVFQRPIGFYRVAGPLAPHSVAKADGFG